MNLEYMKVSLFEISYNKKMNFFTIFKFFEMQLYKDTHIQHMFWKYLHVYSIYIHIIYIINKYI